MAVALRRSFLSKFLRIKPSPMAMASLPETSCSSPKLPFHFKPHPLFRPSPRPQFHPFQKPFARHFSHHTNSRIPESQSAVSQPTDNNPVSPSDTPKPPPVVSPRTNNNPLNPAEKLLVAIIQTLATFVTRFLVRVDPFHAPFGARMGGYSFSSPSSVSPSSASYSLHALWRSSRESSSRSSIYVADFKCLARALTEPELVNSESLACTPTETDGTSVIRIQVGLSCMARSLQRDLHRIAEEADTSTPAGLIYVLTEATLALRIHPESYISAYASVDINSAEGAEKRFNQLSIEERGKFDEETLANVNGVKSHKSMSQRPRNSSNEKTVITILVAAKGVHAVPVVNTSSDLQIALRKLGSIPSSRIMAIEVLWPPQDDTLSLK